MTPSLRILLSFLILLSAYGLEIQSAEADSPVKIEVTVETLARFSPRARADLVSVIASQWPQATAAGINSPERILHFLSEIATETGGLREVSENLNYSAERLVAIFPSRVTPVEAQQLAHNPVAIANHVYNGRLGNRPPNDGWTYRGSGLLQLTGRSNYAARGDELGLPFESDPDLVRTPLVAFQSAVAYWKARGLNEKADGGNLEEIRSAVNGGLNGLSEDRIWLARARRTLNTLAQREPNAGDDENLALEKSLKTLGFLPNTPEGSRAGPVDLNDALKRFQRSRGLSETGTEDEDTLYELTNPDNFKGSNQ